MGLAAVTVFGGATVIGLPATVVCGKVTGAFERGRNDGGGNGAPQNLAGQFRPYEKESSISAVVVRHHHGSADRSSKLVAVERRDDGGEVILSVRVIVTQKLVHRSMYLVGSRLGDHVDDRACIPAINGAVAILQNRKFLQHIGIGESGGDVVIHVHIQSAIERVGRLVWTGAVYG